MLVSYYRLFGLLILATGMALSPAGVWGGDTFSQLRSPTDYLQSDASPWLVRGQEEEEAEAEEEETYEVRPVSFSRREVVAEEWEVGPQCGYEVQDCGDCCGCTNRCGFPEGGSCADCCRQGFFGGGELVWLKVFDSEDGSADFNYRTGFRGWGGWQRDDGLGLRVTGFDYFQRATRTRNVVDTNYLDLEVIDSFNICNWNLMLGGGIRYLDYRDTAAFADRFSGVGPVVSGQVTRAVNCNLSLVVLGRQSLLYGNGTAAQSVTAAVTEIQLGAQYNRELQVGGMGFVRIGWEGQYYGGIDDDDSENVSLVGGVLSAGWMR